MPGKKSGAVARGDHHQGGGHEAAEEAQHAGQAPLAGESVSLWFPMGESGGGVNERWAWVNALGGVGSGAQNSTLAVKWGFPTKPR